MNLEILKLKLVRESEVEYDSIDSLEAAAQIFKKMLKDESQEVFSMIAVDTKGKPVGYFEVHRGALDRSIVSVREVVKRALLSNAAAVIVAHNHPSGNATPSSNDYFVSDALKAGLATVEIKLLDHLVIGDNIRSAMNS